MNKICRITLAYYLTGRVETYIHVCIICIVYTISILSPVIRRSPTITEQWRVRLPYFRLGVISGSSFGSIVYLLRLGKLRHRCRKYYIILSRASLMGARIFFSGFPTYVWCLFIYTCGLAGPLCARRPLALIVNWRKTKRRN